MLEKPTQTNSEQINTEENLINYRLYKIITKIRNLFQVRKIKLQTKAWHPVAFNSGDGRS